MNKTHAHEVLHMMEGNNYATKQELYDAIVSKFGADTLFHTCSEEDLSVDSLIDFLEAKGKFKPVKGGFTMDITKVCETY